MLLTQMSLRISKTLEGTVFQGSPIVPVAARPGAENGSDPPVGLDVLIDVCKYVYHIC